jgi:hypothetical protein
MVINEVVMDTEWVTDEETGKVSEIDAERLGIYYSDLIPVLIKATQQQQEEIELLKRELAKLKKQVRKN